MKKFVLLTAAVISLMGCSVPVEMETEPTEELNIENAGIRDLLKIIQDNPSSLGFREALDKYFIMTNSDDYSHVPFHKSLDIRILENDSVILYGSRYHLDSVRLKCFEYLTFQGPWKEHKSIEHKFESHLSSENLYYTRGLIHISVEGDPIMYDNVQAVLIEVSKAIDDYKENLGNVWFEKESEELAERESYLIDSLVGIRLQVLRFPYGYPDGGMIDERTKKY
ncbi:hypothetical protein O3Q51_11675 [Cryomorphaceae bacterium 1068]|nr:hypothetical protein [Cryomorphaceae bacterium 1068]